MSAGALWSGPGRRLVERVVLFEDAGPQGRRGDARDDADRMVREADRYVERRGEAGHCAQIEVFGRRWIFRHAVQQRDLALVVGRRLAPQRFDAAGRLAQFAGAAGQDQPVEQARKLGEKRFIADFGGGDLHALARERAGDEGGAWRIKHRA